MTIPMARPGSRVLQGVFTTRAPLVAASRLNVVQCSPGVRSADAAGRLQLPPDVAGRPLPAAVLRKMESAFNASFSDVRVFVGPQAAQIGSIAFTIGSQIHFAPGHYSPETLHGQRLLGHELAHVVQQRTGRVRNPFGSGVAVVQDRALEAEADRMGMKAASVQAVQAKCASGPVNHTARAAAHRHCGCGTCSSHASPRATVQQRPWRNAVPARRPAWTPPSATVQRTVKFSPNWSHHSEAGDADEQDAIRAACDANTTAMISDNATSANCDVYVRTGWHVSDADPKSHAQAMLGFSDWVKNDMRVGCNRDYTCHIYKDSTGECWYTPPAVVKKRETEGAKRNKGGADSESKSSAVK